MWALELQQAAKRSDECNATTNGVNKCLSTTPNNDNDDIEFLLLNEHNQDETSASDQSPKQLDEIDSSNDPNNTDPCDTTLNTCSVHNKCN